MASPSLFLPAPTRTVAPPPGGGGGGGGRPSSSSSRPAVAASSSLVVATSSSSQPTTSAKAKAKATAAPSYEERCRAASELSRLTSEQRRANQGSKSAKLFVPRSLKDFGDGGSYPEIHVAQYPRHMGNPHLAKRRAAADAGGGGKSGGGGGGSGGGGGAVSGKVNASTSSALINVEIDSTGEVSYDAIVTGGTNADKKVYSRLTDLRGSKPSPEDVALPTHDEERLATERTAAALGAITSAKTQMDKPTGSAMVQAATSANQESKTKFVKYTPRADAPGYNPTAKQRVIQLVPAQLDPMQPPKHMHRKDPRGPAEDPVPVLHAPPEKLSKEEREAWNVPACISNWKNTRGYTIPLDKRLAADGRGLRDETTINPNFATLSESLYVAERQAREEVKMRSQVQKRLAVSEKERREEELRELASRARRERAGEVVRASEESAGQAMQAREQAALAAGSGGGSASGGGRGDDAGDRGHGGSEYDNSGGSSNRDASAAVDQEDRPPTEEEVAAKQRERLRLERRKEREKELRLEGHRGAAGAAGGANAEGEDDLVKRRRLESDRDVSEKIALGQHTGTGGGGGGEVDSRLYNQSAGMDSGFGAEDEYNTYSKPLFDRDGVSSSSVYRPTRGEGATVDADVQYDELAKGATTKFQADKAFAGADNSGGGNGGGGASAGPRSAPVQFEKGGTK